LEKNLIAGRNGEDRRRGEKKGKVSVADLCGVVEQKKEHAADPQAAAKEAPSRQKE